MAGDIGPAAQPQRGALTEHPGLQLKPQEVYDLK